MKKFNFRLERVLDHRNSVKKEKAGELAAKNRDLFDAEKRVEDIIAAQDAVEHPDEQLLTMAEIALSGKYQEALRDALVAQRLAVLEAKDAVEAARQAYVEKAVEAEVLETLRQKMLDEHNLESKRNERKASDRMTVMRHKGKKPEAG
jgi:flagellar export protein FliJ